MERAITTTTIPFRASSHVSSGQIDLEAAATGPLLLTVNITFVDVPYAQPITPLTRKSDLISEN